MKYYKRVIQVDTKLENRVIYKPKKKNRTFGNTKEKKRVFSLWFYIGLFSWCDFDPIKVLSLGALFSTISLRTICNLGTIRL